ncbi:MAG: aspartate carbamoyltransferase catalytic subunit [Trueperaceae bacterium]|nr:aspartate carbamoyltransferase catalytic subunit [Trueperaceae bacterium]
MSERFRRLLDFSGMDVDRILAILATTDVMAQVLQRPVKRVPALQGFTVATLFFEDSTRTRLSFERAARAQSADVMAFARGGTSLSKGESLRDTVATLDALQVDAYVVRHPAAGAAHQVASWTDAAVINAGDGRRAHPTQALLDAYAYREATGRPFEETRLTIVGDVAHSRVARSDAELWQRLGAEVVLCGPPTLLPPDLAALPGVRLETRLEPALDGAHAVMALRLQHERMDTGRIHSTAAYAERYQLTEARLAGAHPDAVVLHPGPMNRDVEIEGALADGPRSLITRQVAAGVPVRMAVLYHLLVGKGSR